MVKTWVEVSLKRRFNLGMCNCRLGSKDLEQELELEIQLALAKVPAEPSMKLGVSVDDGISNAYHTYKCPHLC